MRSKRCPRCELVLALTEFYATKNGRGASECRSCARLRAKAYRAAHPDRVRALKQRRKHADNNRRRKQYGGKREAISAQRRAHYAQNKFRFRARQLRDTYGLSVEQYIAMAIHQRGCCALCRRAPSKPLVVDHCHDTGRVRGLLCTGCNTGIGKFADDPVRLIAAANYVAGYTPESCVAAVTAGELSRLVHTGLAPVQVQPATTEQSADA